jgi:hypothetical protein
MEPKKRKGRGRKGIKDIVWLSLVGNGNRKSWPKGIILMDRWML